MDSTTQKIELQTSASFSQIHWCMPGGGGGAVRGAGLGIDIFARVCN